MEDQIKEKHKKNYTNLNEDGEDKIMFFLGKIRDKVYEMALKCADVKGNDELYLSIMFFHRLGYRLNLKKPVTLNQKIQWIKLYDHNPLYTKYADKYCVREHIKETIGEEYLIPLIGVYEAAEDIDFSILPDQFVLKCNHGAGYNIICKDKSMLNQDEIVSILAGWLKDPFYSYKREYHYKGIKPLILCEKFMKDVNADELNDYKFFCINGRVVFIQVDYDRYHHHTRNIYDLNLKLMNVRITFPNNSSPEKPLPKQIPEMINIAESLSVGFPIVRVDLYLVNGVVYFGEMTFTPGAGFSRYIPRSYEYELGSLVELKGDEVNV